MNLAQLCRRSLALLTPLFAIAILLISGDPAVLCQDLSTDQSAEVEKIVNLQRNLSSGRLNSSGVQLRAKEVSRGRNGDSLVVSYQLFGSGFTADRYDLVTIPITMNADVVAAGSDLLLAKDGQVIDGPNDPRVIILPDFVPGEPFRAGLLSKDRKERAFLTIVPNPIEGTDHGCTLDVVRLLPKFEIAFIEGAGFPADTEVDLEANSLGEVHNGKLKTDSEGQLQTGILPFVKGKSKGQTQLTLGAPRCKPKVKFNWGTTSE